ncbi:MAG: hypothetical protein KDJ52_12125 [Anaerolineae bacterium]|nr:hypothetical protein [Anaerolineae bacterium]
MVKSKRYSFILWANGFEEMMAAVFIAELRQANRRVKLVGLTRKPSRGAYGLIFTPDISLDEALPLAANAVLVIIPSRSASFAPLQTDPRLSPFFHAAHKAYFITGPLTKADRALFPPNCEWIEIEPSDEALLKVVRKIVI